MVAELARARKTPCRLITAQITGAEPNRPTVVITVSPARSRRRLQVLVDQWKLQLPAREILRELQGMKAMRSASFRYEGQPDDLAMTVVLALWWMRKHVAWRTPRTLAA